MKEGWVEKKLKDACTIRPKKSEATSKLKATDLVSFVPMEDLGINQPYLNLQQERLLGDVSGSYTYFADDDVLLAKITPCFENGKVGIARNLKNGIGFGSSEFLVYRPKEDLFPEYLYYFLNQETLREIGKKTMGGAVGQQRIQKIFYEDTTIPLPPLSEQKEIVAILDELFAKIDKAKANIEKNIENVEELYQRKLSEYFSNENTAWEEVPLEKYITLIDYRGRTPEKTKEGVRLITAKNVKLGYLQKEPQEFIAADNYEAWMRRGIPNFGDVIFTTEAPLGNVAQIDTYEKLAFAQRIIVMQPAPEKFNQTFLKYMLLSPVIRERIFEKETGATVTGIKSKLLKKIPIPLPPLEEQKAIVAALDELKTKTDALKDIYKQKLLGLEEMRKTVLEMAFRGELV